MREPDQSAYLHIIVMSIKPLRPGETVEAYRIAKSEYR